MHHSMYEGNQENEEDEESEIADGEMFIDLNDLSIPMSYPYDPQRQHYCTAQAVLKEIGNRLCLLTKADNSLIDKKLHKKILKKELNRFLFYLNAAQLKTFMENHRTLLAKAEQMFKLM